MTTIAALEPPARTRLRLAGPRAECSGAPRWSSPAPVLPITVEQDPGHKPNPAPPVGTRLVLELFVRDLERSRRFYTALGFQLARSGPRFAELIWDGCSLCLYQPPVPRWAHTVEADEAPRTNLQVWLEDLEVVWHRAVQLGARVLEPVADQPYGRRDFMIADPDGFGVRFVSRSRV